MKSYKTQNLYEASYILVKGFKLTARDTQGSKTALVFAQTPELPEAILTFYNGTGQASAKQLFDAYRSLKDMVFQR